MPNVVPNSVDLEYLLEEYRRDLMLSFNCHGVAVVESFDAGKQTVRASMAYQKTFYDQTNTGKFEERLESYPVLIDCPAVVLKGGAFSLKMPIKKGDECLVIFNDRSIDQWFSTGSNKRLDSNRLHAFNDAIVLVGLSSSPKALSGYENDKVVLGDGTHDLSLGGGSVTIKKDRTQVEVGDKISVKNDIGDLKGILTDLITVLSGAAAGGNPLQNASMEPIANALAPITVKINGLLK